MVDPLIKMPCFNTEDFKGDREMPASARAVRWNCPLSFPMLINRFFGFYAREFYWGYEVVSIRTGRRLYTIDPVYHRLNFVESPLPHIEDPFLLWKNLNYCLGFEQYDKLRGALNAACAQLQNNKPPSGFLIALEWPKRITNSAQEDKADTNKSKIDEDVGADKSQVNRDAGVDKLLAVEDVAVDKSKIDEDVVVDESKGIAVEGVAVDKSHVDVDDDSMPKIETAPPPQEHVPITALASNRLQKAKPWELTQLQ